MPIQGPSQEMPSSFVVAALLILPVLTTAASFYAARDLTLAIFFLLGLIAFAGVSRTGHDRYYKLLIWSLSLSLLFATTFVSRNLSGYDIHQEYYVFSQTVSQGWHPENALVYNSVLSISILPAILQAVTDLNGVFILKTIFPFLYSFVPVVLYGVYRKFLSSQAAFLSVFLFLAYPTSYVEITALARQEIAELMLAILLWVFLSSEIQEKQAGKVTIVLLTVGLVTSHYSLAFVYILLLAFSILLAKLSTRMSPICTTNVFLFSVLIVLSWYLLISGGITLATLAVFLYAVYNGLLLGLFNPLSRPTIVIQALGFSGALGILHLMNRVTQYAVQLSLVVGFVAFMARVPKNNPARIILSSMIVGFLLLVLSVGLPFFAFGLELSRIYQIALIFISPCFVYGVARLSSWLRKGGSLMHLPFRGTRLPRGRILAAAILTLYFLFVGGWVWAISLDSPTSFVFDWQRMRNSQSIDIKVAYFSEYTEAKDISAALWLRSHASSTRTVCADFVSTDHVLNSYGGFAKYLPLIPDECPYEHDYVYLSEFNVVNGTGTQTLAPAYRIVNWQISEISSELAGMNVIYSGGAEIYLST